MTGRRALWVVLLAVWGSGPLAGCAGAPDVQDNGGESVVTAYAPSSPAESLAQAQLRQNDDLARAAIEKAQKTSSEATAAYMAAERLLATEELRPKQVRPTREEVGRLLLEAQEKWRRHREGVNAQIDLYEAFIAKYPHNWYARHRYAWFLADHQRQMDASEQWRRVIVMAPHFAHAYNNLGSLYNHMGRDIEAVELYRQAITLKGDVATFHINLAVNYSTHRKEVMEKYGWDLPRVFRECIAEYRRARELAPKDAEIARDLATQYILAKYFGVTDTADDAIADWKYYLDLDLTKTQRGIAYRNVGRIYLTQKGDPAAAVGWLEKALELLGGPASKTLLERAKKEVQKGNEAGGGPSELEK